MVDTLIRAILNYVLYIVENENSLIVLNGEFKDYQNTAILEVLLTLGFFLLNFFVDLYQNGFLCQTAFFSFFLFLSGNRKSTPFLSILSFREVRNAMLKILLLGR